LVFLKKKIEKGAKRGRNAGGARRRSHRFIKEARWNRGGPWRGEAKGTRFFEGNKGGWVDEAMKKKAAKIEREADFGSQRKVSGNFWILVKGS